MIAHGVYGWIPEEADDALLQSIKASLAPGGIAYVSFNAQPGGYFRRLLRDAGLWHARDEVGAEAKATKAQELYRFLNEQRVSDSDTYGMLLGREVPALADAQSYRLVHDDLSENWKPALVRGVRRPRGRARARLRGRGGPLQPALGDAPRGRRAAGVEPRGR